MKTTYKIYVKWVLIHCAQLGFLFINAILAADTISSNPAAVNVITGTGALGESIGIRKGSGVRLGGLLIEDINYLICGGATPKKSSGNSLFILSLNLNTEKLNWWDGGSFGMEFLQFNGRPTNLEAGLVQDYNNLTGPPPLDRSELYQLWFRQELFDKKLVIRLGKSLPSYDFNNVTRPIHIEDKSFNVPATTSVLYTPIYVNSTLLDVLPGYYNSAYGVVLTYSPTQDLYINYGIYDGNLARGKQTGLRGPQFNSYRFQALELGFDWGRKRNPGNFGIGIWNQSGKLTSTNKITEHGVNGLYVFGTQRLWSHNLGKYNSGLIGFMQGGINDSKTLPVTLYAGAGFTFLGLVSGRIDDSFGIGMAFARLNYRIFSRPHELILQGYYQAMLFPNAYLISALSYIPTPGQAPNLQPALAATARIILLF